MKLGPGVEGLISAHAHDARPAECVGALMGEGDQVTHVLRLINSSPRPEREFEVSAREYLRAEAEASRLGLEVLGLYHSHVDGPAVLSARDAAMAGHFRCSVVVSVRDATMEIFSRAG